VIPGSVDFRFSTRCYPAADSEARTFAIVGEIARCNLPSLEVSYRPDAVYISMRDKDGNLREQTVNIPEWADTDTAKGVYNNGVLTVTVEENV
jgi:HSP20 family molecular chaperone IbpA